MTLRFLIVIGAAGLLGNVIAYLYDYLRYIRPSRRLRARITADLAAHKEN